MSPELKDQLNRNSCGSAIEYIEQLEQQNEHLNERLKAHSEQKRWFTYCSDDGYEEHESEEIAREYASDLISDWLQDGWGEEVANVRMGVVTHKAAEGERTYREGAVDEDGCDEAGVWWDPDWGYMTNWTLKPLPAPPKGDRE